MHVNLLRPILERERPSLKIGEESDIFIILARARIAMRQANWTPSEITDATVTMMSGDNKHLLSVIYDLCDVE